MKKLMCVAVAACALGGSLAVQAHHSANAQYDLTKVVEMQGELLEFANINPHAYWYFNMPGPDGTVVKWSIESPGPAAWRRYGVRIKDDIKPGQVYKFKASPALKPNEPNALMRSVEINGKWLGLIAN